MTKKIYAICREEKLSDLRSITRSNKHNLRLQTTLNADPSKPVPRILFGHGNPTADIKALLPKKIRKNAVIAVEVLLSATPEWFEKASPSEIEDWILAQTAWLQCRHGSRLIQALAHADEKTLHVHALWIPLKDGRLNYRDIQGSPQAQVALQDSYAAAMSRFGLVRGQRKSKRKHEHSSIVVDQLSQAKLAIVNATKAAFNLLDHLNPTMEAQDAFKVMLEILCPKAEEPEKKGGKPLLPQKTLEMQRFANMRNVAFKPNF